MKTHTYLLKKNIINVLQTQSWLRNLVLASIMMLFILPIQAQQIYELDSWVNAKKMQKSAGNVNEGVRVASLAYELNTMLYYENGIAKTYGEGKPVFLEAEVSDIPALYKSNVMFDNVELIRIKLRNNVTQKNLLNVASLSHFKSLKYIVLECAYNCNAQDLAKRYIGSTNVTMFYSIVITQ